MYYSRIVLSVGGSVWYVVRNLRCTVIIDSVLANCKTRNTFLFPVHAMFSHDFPIAVKSASTPERLVHKQTCRDSLSIDMLPFGVTIPATVPQGSEIPEVLWNYPVLWQLFTAIWCMTPTKRAWVLVSVSVYNYLQPCPSFFITQMSGLET
jgi:hypothetical protein